MEKILIIIIILCLFILMFNCSNNKYVENFSKSNKYVRNIFPGQSLMDLDKIINIDYEFKKIEIPILEIDDPHDINNLNINYGFMDEIFSNNKINYDPKNASEIYEKNK